MLYYTHHKHSDFTQFPANAVPAGKGLTRHQALNNREVFNIFVVAPRDIPVRIAEAVVRVQVRQTAVRAVARVATMIIQPLFSWCHVD